MLEMRPDCEGRGPGSDRRAEAELDGRGRLVIRPSGTEPVIRVTAEGDDRDQVEAVVDRVCEAVRAAAAA